MTKVILIYPKFPVAFKVNLPIGLLHLGTYLKNNGVSVKLIDCTVEANYKELIAQEIKDASCVGISVMTAQIPHTRELLSFIKDELKSSVPVVLGGVHPTLYPSQTIAENFVDYVVVGEGELTFLKFLGSTQPALRQS